MTEKPHHGRIKNWRKESCGSGEDFLIVGEFLDHPQYRGPICHTSMVISHDEATGEIETRNSRYQLVAAGEPTRMPGWPWKGDRLTFLGKNGYEHELAKAKAIFEIGKEYEVDNIHVGDWSHSIQFVGIPGEFNGVMFSTAKSTDH